MAMLGPFLHFLPAQKRGPERLHARTLRDAHAEDVLDSGILQKTAGTLKVCLRQVDFGDHADDAAVEHGGESRGNLAEGTRGILHEDKHVAIRGSGDERGIEAAVFQKLTGRIDEIAEKIHISQMQVSRRLKKAFI